ncbi:hypothetical protein N9N67_01075 [Bacteriovoracaceae bacterium]|nr:hypothetical protein [Bacteriovoracaceae bacterium]
MKKLIVIILGLFLLYAHVFAAPNNNPPSFTCSSPENLFIFLHELTAIKDGVVTNDDVDCLEQFVLSNSIKSGCDNSTGAYDYGLYDIDDSCIDPSKSYLGCVNQDDLDIMKDFVSGNATLKASALDRAIHTKRTQERGCTLTLPQNCSYAHVANKLLDLNNDSKVDVNDGLCANEAFLNSGNPVNPACKKPSDTSISYSPVLNAFTRLPMSSVDAQQISAYGEGSVAAKDLPLIKWIGDYHNCKEGGVNSPPIITLPEKNKIRQVFVNKLEYTGIQFYDYDGLGNNLSDSASLKVINAPANYMLKDLPPKGQYSFTFMPQPADDNKVITTQFEVTDALDANSKTTHSLDFKIDFFEVNEVEPATGDNHGIPNVSLVDNGKIINIPEHSIVSFPEDCIVGVKCDMGMEIPIDLPSGVNWQAEIVNGINPHPAMPPGNPSPEVISLGDDKFLFSWMPTAPVVNQEIRIRFFFEASGSLDNSAGFYKYYRFNVVDKLGINLIAGYPDNDISFVFTDQNPAYWLNTQVVGGRLPYSQTTYSMAPMPVPNSQIDFQYDGTSYGTFSFDPVTDGNLKFLDGFLGDQYNVTFEATDADGDKASANLSLIVSDLRLEFDPQPTHLKKYQIPAGTQQIINITPKGGIAPVTMNFNPNDLTPGTYNLIGNVFYFDASLLNVGDSFHPTFSVFDSRNGKRVERKYPIEFEIISSLIIEPRNIAQGTYRAWKDEIFQLPFITDNSGPEVASSYYVKGAPALSGSYDLDTSLSPPIFSLDLSSNAFTSGSSVTFDFGVNSSLGKKYEITTGIDVFPWQWQITSQHGGVNLLKDPGGKNKDATLNVVMREMIPHFFTIILPDPGPHADWTAKIVSYTPKIPSGLGGTALVNHMVNKTHFDFWRVGPPQAGFYTAHFQFTDGYTTIDRKLTYEVGVPTDLTFGVSPIAKDDEYVHFKEWGNHSLDLIALKGKAPYNYSIKSGAIDGMSVDNDTDKFIYENDKMVIGKKDYTLMVTDDANDTKELDLSVKISDLQIAFNPEPDDIIGRDHLQWNVANDKDDEFNITTRVDVGMVNRWTFWAGEGETMLPKGSYNFSGILGNVTLYPKNIPNGVYTMKLMAEYFSHGVTREYTLTFNVGPTDIVVGSEDCEYVPFYIPGVGNLCASKDQVVRMEFGTGLPAAEPLMNWRDTVQLQNLNTYLSPETITGDESFCYVSDREDLKKQLEQYSHSDLENKNDYEDIKINQANGKKNIYSRDVFYTGNAQSSGPSGAAYYGSVHCGKLLEKYAKYETYNKFSDIEIEVAELDYVFPVKDELIDGSVDNENKKEDDPPAQLTLSEIKEKYDLNNDGMVDVEEKERLVNDFEDGLYPYLEEDILNYAGHTPLDVDGQLANFPNEHQDVGADSFKKN